MCCVISPIFHRYLFPPFSAYQEVKIHSLSNRNMERLICGEGLRLLLPPGTSIRISAFLTLLMIHVIFRAGIQPSVTCVLSVTSAGLLSHSQSCWPTPGITAAICTFLSLGLFGKSTSVCPHVQISIFSLCPLKTQRSSSESNVSPSLAPVGCASWR